MTKVLLGASGLLSNGHVISRVMIILLYYYSIGLLLGASGLLSNGHVISRVPRPARFKRAREKGAKRARHLQGAAPARDKGAAAPAQTRARATCPSAKRARRPRVRWREGTREDGVVGWGAGTGGGGVGGVRGRKAFKR